jgi:hypothetical protein
MPALANHCSKQIGGTWSTASEPSRSIDWFQHQVATVTTQRLVRGNNRVTFPIRRAALIHAILSANEHIKPYENS